MSSNEAPHYCNPSPPERGPLFPETCAPSLEHEPDTLECHSLPQTCFWEAGPGVVLAMVPEAFERQVVAQAKLGSLF
jgi:hypothetical protein